jgi:Tol biopolymer transport system component
MTSSAGVLRLGVLAVGAAMLVVFPSEVHGIQDPRAGASPGPAALSPVRASPDFGLDATPRSAVRAPAGITADDLHRLRSVTAAELSPDGRWVAYTVQNRQRPGRPYTQLWLADARTGETRRLGDAQETGAGPVWSPNSRWIAYFGSDGERTGLFVRAPDGGAARHVTDVQATNHPMPGTGARLSWAPDSRRIAFLSATSGPEPAEATADGDPIVITRYLYRTTGADGVSYFNDNRRLHIFIADVETRAVRQLTDGDRYEHSIDWSPGG